jgi:aminopeptidase-like protein
MEESDTKHDCGEHVSPDNCGQPMHQLMSELFPICRSITGNGVRETLRILQRHVPITVFEVPTGTKVYDWTIPKEWNIRNAFILDRDGNKIVDFNTNNLHVVGYSIPTDKIVSLAELQKHLYSVEDQPDAIPYVTSYYEERWGFCLSHNQRSKLEEGPYRVVIDSDLKEGFLSYGEMLLPGESRKEIFLSTYICHPSMANNELSGPVVTAFLATWIASKPRKYSFRIVFIPETIGSITYLSRNLDDMRKNIVAGFNVTCVGDERAFSYLPSRKGSTLADKAALNILTSLHPEFIQYTFLERGSDERQYCSPGVDLPVVSVMRSKYREYPQYHTSSDDLSFVTSSGLQGGFEVLRDCIELIEKNTIYRVTCLGEPQLGRRRLYPFIGTRDTHRYVSDMMNLLAHADGNNDLIDISNIIRVPVRRLYPLVENLVAAGLLEEVS